MAVPPAPFTRSSAVAVDVLASIDPSLFAGVVLTTSSDDRDIERCYRSGVNSYLRKPVDLRGYLKSIERLKEYWFDIVLLPEGE